MNTNQSHVLIVDDDTVFCQMLADLIDRMGHHSEICHRIDACRQKLEKTQPDLVLLDVGLPDGSGLTLLPWIRQLPAAPEVIIITGAGAGDGAEMAIINGAWDYLLKTTAFERINLIVTRALEHHRTSMQLKALKSLGREGIIGSSAPIKRCLDLVSQAALNDFNVLITGESGTGKELFAKAIHTNSNRSASRLVVVDCASLPKTLVESVLFGYVKGAFTGADKAATGLLLEAEGGTLFMDEVGELPHELQRIFLRVLQERRFRPVGAKHEETCNFRLIAATNKDLDQSVKQGQFRDDLLFRLRSLTIHLPPLRDWIEDVPELANHFVTTMTQSKSMTPKRLSPELLEALAHHHWPGNVRELQHVLQAAVAASMQDPTLLSQHLPPYLRVALTQMRVQTNQANYSDSQSVSIAESEGLPTIREFRHGQDGLYLKKLMHDVDGDVRKAADQADISLSRLYSLLKEHGLKS